MLKDINFTENRFYAQKSDRKPYEFYTNALSNSNSLHLLLGYFTLSSINVLSYGFAKFLENEGVLKIVLNEFIKIDDIDIIIAGESKSIENTHFNLTNNFQELKNILSKPSIHFFECLAWLIAKDRIQFKFIRNVGAGIPHYKDGIFSDGKNKVGFSGSCNFTGSGIVNNRERVTVILDWEDQRSSNQINTLESDFQEYFSGKSNDVTYLDSSQIKENIQNTFGNKELVQILEDEEELKGELEEQFKKYDIVEDQITLLSESNSEPRFPGNGKPRPYQIEAYNNWVNNNYQGLFAMATGTGKTITSLNCILEEYKKNGFYKLIVLVPTISLAQQWEDEIANKFNFQNIINCNSRNKNWEEEIRDIGRSIKLKTPINFVILTTYDTFRSKKFNYLFNDFFYTEMSQMTIIADEAHRFGSNSLIKVMPEKITKRIGLSATPHRQFDDFGVSAISNFFKSTPPNYTFSYNMKKAIEDHVLCEYYYYPKLVGLDQEEVREYAIISKKLVPYFVNGKYIDNDFVKRQLMKRKNIIHKARNKSNCLINIIDEIGKDNFNYAFIYVPEGNEASYENSDIDLFDPEDQILIQTYTELLYNNYGFKLRSFTGETNDRKEVLNQFKNGHLNALLAMKCLDEGVDIPQTKYAIFCSSTGNPRQYIQRRGRVLRRFDGKEFAYMFDMIVKTNLDPTNSDPKMIKIEKAIMISELTRLINFAVLAVNKTECLAIMEPYCTSLGIDIYDLANKEEEKYNN